MKQLLFIIISVLFPSLAFAQSYGQLWKSVGDAQAKDLPQTEISALDKIVAKASREGNYGQLLAAGMRRSSCRVTVSPDSLHAEIQRLSSAAAATSSPVLRSVYYAILGDIYRANYSLGADRQRLQRDYWAKAMANPDALAAVKAGTYEPLVTAMTQVSGYDSKYFNDDLLHVVGFLTGNSPLLERYYKAHGNRAAACLSALLSSTAVGRTDRESIAALDSVIAEYGDVDVCAEAAVRRYSLMPESTNADAGAKYDYGQTVISRWPSWKNINTVRNGQRQLLRAEFQTLGGSRTTIPAKASTLRFSSRNISKLTLTLTRLNTDGATQLDASSDAGLKKVLAMAIPSTAVTVEKPITFAHGYETTSDSISVPALPVGVWLMKFTFDCDASTPTPHAVYRIYNVSNVAFVSESLPGGKTRFVVVDATTGQPLAGAHIRVIENRNYGQKGTVSNLTTDRKGEVIFARKENGGMNVWAYTDADNAAPSTGIYSDYYNSSTPMATERMSMFTDRSLYRPGQTVHTAAIVYRQDDATRHRSAAADRRVTFTLRDANYKEVATTTATTDRFGTASTDFALPAAGLTGQFSVTAQTVDASGSVYFNVEEYKRPTFEVTFDDYVGAYTAGDTITVSGRARTYSGVAVQNADVAYTVVRRNAWWWRWVSGTSDGTTLAQGTVRTGADGSFSLRVPVVLPDADAALMKEGRRLYHYYNISVGATVTDAGGESHEGEMTLPLGTNATALTCDLPDKILIDSLSTVTFRRVNMAGKEIPGDVMWRVDEPSHVATTAKWLTAKANTAVAIGVKNGWKAASGAYVLTAVCGTDTLRKPFVVFSATDKHPVVATHDWFWQSAAKFPADGSPVSVQFGSSDDRQHVVYTILSARNEIIEQGVLDQSNALTTRKLTYKESYGDGLVVNVAWVRDGITYTHRAEIVRPDVDNRLRLSWKTFRNRLLPGQKEEWTLTVLAPAGGRKAEPRPANAQLMATLYDKSLDQLLKHEWSFEPSYSQSLPSAEWIGVSRPTLYVNSYANISLLKDSPLSFRSIDDTYYAALSDGWLTSSDRNYRLTRSNMLMGTAAGMNVRMKANDFAAAAPELMEVAVVSKKDAADDNASDMKDVYIRENLNATAFFYPRLTTDSEGNITMKFTLPEAVTTWRFMGLAHDTDINYGMITADVVAAKTVMVEPNAPRFVRVGDKAQLSARISNTSDHGVSGTATMELLDAATEKVITTERQQFSVDSGSTATAFFAIPVDKCPAVADGGMLIVRVTAEGDGFADGEQQYLAVVPNREPVVNTYPFTQVGPSTTNIPLSSLLPKGADNVRVKLEYTNNPAWLMVQALPYVANANDKDAVSLSTAYFANSISRMIIGSNAHIKNVFSQWRMAAANGGSSLESSLKLNDDLKALGLESTPWLKASDDDAARKRALAAYFDENSLDNSLATIKGELRNLINPDGSFSWWPGMYGSFPMTVAVAKTLVRLDAITAASGRGGDGRESAAALLNDRSRGATVWSFLDKKAAKEVAQMQRLDAKKIAVWPSDALCDYVYASALAHRRTTADIRYIVDKLAKQPRALTIYGKANAAVILAMYGRNKTADEYLRSISEYSVYKEPVGRYFDTRKAAYSWFDYKIPTQTAAIEAWLCLRPNDTATIAEMRRWLLQEKRTQTWESPLASANAIYAFMAPVGTEGSLSASAAATLATAAAPRVSVGGKAIALPQGEAGTGYVMKDISTEATASAAGSVDISKTSAGVSWGAVYAQFLQPAAEIGTLSSGISVKREIVAADGKPASQLKVGDRVRVRITVKADRDYDFVEIVDKRAACLEPVAQLSGYRDGCYVAPRASSTAFFFDRMAKGTHVVEFDYFIDRAGDYTSGSCTAQCAYAPEFIGRQGGSAVSVSRK